MCARRKGIADVVRWAKVARVVVPLIGVGCAVAVYVYLRPRPDMTDAAPVVRLGDDAVAISKDTTTKLLGPDGKPIYEITSRERRVMADGRLELRGDVRLTFARNGVPYTVTANEADTAGVAGPTGEEQETVVFRGKVRMKGEDGFSVDTEEGTYFNVEQRLTFPGAVAFTRGDLSGSGVGGELYMDRSVLWLFDKSEMRIAPAEGGVPVVVTGKRIGLAEADRYLRVEENGRLTRDGQSLTSDLIMLFFAEGSQTVQRIEMDGQSRVLQTGGGDRPDMRADNIDLDFATDTSALSHARLDGTGVLTTRDSSGTTRISGSMIDLTVGVDGRTVTRLETAAPTEVQLPRSGAVPARTIRSATLIAEGSEPKGLDRAVFSGGVNYREVTAAARGQAATSRVATSDSLVLGLAGGLNQVDVAEFRQGFSVVDGTMTAKADEGRYDAKAETLQLRANVPARQRPNIVDQEIEVTAQAIDVNLKQDAFVARGAVVSLRKSAPAAKGAKSAEAAAPGLFDEGKPISGNADALTYDKTTGVAVYTGEVALLQSSGPGKESSVLRGDEVRFDDKRRDLTAAGHVRSTFVIDQATDATPKQGAGSTQLSSDRMAYAEAARTAVYTGSAVMESPNGERLVAEQITLEMMTERRALKRLQAVAAAATVLRATLPAGRQVTGQHLTYDAATEEYVVRGNPATFISPSKTKPGICEVGTGTKLTFLRTQEWSMVTNEGGAVGRAEDKKCAEVIK